MCHIKDTDLRCISSAEFLFHNRYLCILGSALVSHIRVSLPSYHIPKMMSLSVMIFCIFPFEFATDSLHYSNIFTSCQTMLLLVSNILDVIASDICLLSHIGPFLHPQLTSMLTLTQDANFHSSLFSPGLGVPPPINFPLPSTALPPRNSCPHW